MKPDIWEKVNRLSGVTFYCSWDKRFVNIMTSLGPEAALTETQEKWVLINPEEEARIRDMWDLNTWPQDWSDEDIDAIIPIDAIRLSDDGRLVYQSLLI